MKHKWCCKVKTSIWLEFSGKVLCGHCKKRLAPNYWKIKFCPFCTAIFNHKLKKGNWYDTVIPNSYDPDDFPYSQV